MNDYDSYQTTQPTDIYCRELKKQKNINSIRGIGPIREIATAYFHWKIDIHKVLAKFVSTNGIRLNAYHTNSVVRLVCKCHERFDYVIAKIASMLSIR